jgi:hypothetical protein
MFIYTTYVCTEHRVRTIGCRDHRKEAFGNAVFGIRRVKKRRGPVKMRFACRRRIIVCGMASSSKPLALRSQAVQLTGLKGPLIRYVLLKVPGWGRRNGVPLLIVLFLRHTVQAALTVENLKRTTTVVGPRTAGVVGTHRPKVGG